MAERDLPSAYHNARRVDDVLLLEGWMAYKEKQLINYTPIVWTKGAQKGLRTQSHELTALKELYDRLLDAPLWYTLEDILYWYSLELWRMVSVRNPYRMYTDAINAMTDMEYVIEVSKYNDGYLETEEICYELGVTKKDPDTHRG